VLVDGVAARIPERAADECWSRIDPGLEPAPPVLPGEACLMEAVSEVSTTFVAITHEKPAVTSLRNSADAPVGTSTGMTSGSVRVASTYSTARVARFCSRPSVHSA
jgi:hypothetical protein